MAEDHVILTVDFLFIGLGAGNSLLLLQMFEAGLLSKNNVAIIEPETKTVNDRTFCFWSTPEELKKLKLDGLVSAQWDTMQLNGGSKQNIFPLKYYHVRGIDLYDEVRSVREQVGVHLFPANYQDKPEPVANGFELGLGHTKIIAKKVFDSRPPSFVSARRNESHLYQSFYGWEIKTEKATIDPATVVLMDFNIPQQEQCQFIYLLPYSDQSALVEVTRFGSKILNQEEAEEILIAYLDKMECKFSRVAEEKGVIPMSSAAIISADYGPNWVSTGAKANLIKPSTGYAFYAMAWDAFHQVEALKLASTHKRPNKRTRFAFYDRVLLKILEKSPQQGKRIFVSLFKHTEVKDVLIFLGEKSSLKSELKIFSKLPLFVFIKTSLQDSLSLFVQLPPVVFALLFTLFSLLIMGSSINNLATFILAAGFLTLGLSHGAVDHLTDRRSSTDLKFIVPYLFKGALLGLVWYWFPDVALLVFIAYSAWHFGQADFQEWRFKQGTYSFLWGLLVLLSVLFYHFDETLTVLAHIPGLYLDDYLHQLNENTRTVAKASTTLFALVLAVAHRSKWMFLSLAYLLLSSLLPLLISFGIYFVAQHSRHGWRHLKKDLSLTSYQLWLKSLPFSIGGIALISAFMLTNLNNYLGIFFIVLSCISIPHVLSMHFFYKK